MTNSILIYSVEDDEDIAFIINKTLTNEGYTVKTFPSGESFLDAFKKRKPNIVLLDLMLPNIQGQDIIKIIRENSNNSDIEVVVISAKGMLEDKVSCLNLGADDYIAKPFELKELISRVNARSRKFKEKNKPNVIKIRDYTLDLDNQTLLKDKEIISLTRSEFSLLALLFKNKGRVVSKEEISLELYGDLSKSDGKAILMILKSLKSKLGQDEKPLITSRYGLGYVIYE